MKPTHVIPWSAGIYEGEGSCQVPTRTNRTQIAKVDQKERWICDLLQKAWGGTVRCYKTTTVKHDGEYFFMWRWFVSGRKARFFLSTIHSYLSPHRQEQVSKALAGRQDYVRGPYDSSVSVRL